MSERVLDARLHGRGGGVEELTPQQELAVRISNLFCGEEAEASYSAALDASVAWIDEFVARLAFNPSPEPVDAEVEAAITFFERSCLHGYNLPKVSTLPEWQTIKTALLRSQAGHGRFDEAMKIADKQHYNLCWRIEELTDLLKQIRGWDVMVSGTGDEVFWRGKIDALLAAQEPREL